MSSKTFTEEELLILSKNPYVQSVSSKGITYTEEFKCIFIKENEKGLSPTAIFEGHGLDLKIVGKHRIESAAKRWRKTYREHGLKGLQDTRKDRSGRRRDKELTMEEKYARLEAENNLLKAENELIKKINLAERRLQKKK